MKPNDSYLNNFCTEQSWKPSHNNQIVSWQTVQRSNRAMPFQLQSGGWMGGGEGTEQQGTGPGWAISHNAAL